MIKDLTNFVRSFVNTRTFTSGETLNDKKTLAL